MVKYSTCHSFTTNRSIKANYWNQLSHTNTAKDTKLFKSLSFSSRKHSSTWLIFWSVDCFIYILPPSVRLNRHLAFIDVQGNESSCKKVWIISSNQASPAHRFCTSKHWSSALERSQGQVHIKIPYTETWILRKLNKTHRRSFTCRLSSRQHISTFPTHLISRSNIT